MVRLGLILFILGLAGCSTTPPKPAQNTIIDPVIQQRVDIWQRMMTKGQHWSDRRRLSETNNFINQLLFVDDKTHWGEEDFWATPLQTLVTGGGDCEDLAIAKYFTLTKMGMDEAKLRLTYVKALTINQAHMVTSYYASPKQIPLILDNLNPVILPADQREDLVPAYSFNGHGLWLNKQRYQLEWANSANQIKPWQHILQVSNEDMLHQQKRMCLYQYHRLPAAQAASRCSVIGE